MPSIAWPRMLAATFAVLMPAATIQSLAGPAAAAGPPSPSAAHAHHVAGVTRPSVPTRAAVPGGTQLWAARYDHNGEGVNLPSSIAVSPDGARVFVSGLTESLDDRSNAVIVAYGTGNGARLWRAFYFGLGKLAGLGAIAVSPDGSTVFAAGATEGSAGISRAALVAYDAATGAKLWARQFASPGSLGSAATSVAVSPDGSRVYLAGSASEDETADTRELSLVGYNAKTGTRLWARQYHGPGDLGGYATAVAASPDGSRVFVTGVAAYGNGASQYETLAYSPAGAQQWAVAYQGLPGRNLPSAIGVSRDSRHVYVTGGSPGSGSALADYATIDYAAATGAALWVARYPGPRHRSVANSLATGPDGTVYVTGSSEDQTAGRWDYATVAYDPATGSARWARRYPTSAANAGINRVVASPDGSAVYMAGGGNGTYLTIAYKAATGSRLWLARYTAGGDTNAARAAAVSPDGSTVFITGLSTRQQGNWGIGTVAYAAGSSGG